MPPTAGAVEPIPLMTTADPRAVPAASRLGVVTVSYRSGDVLGPMLGSIKDATHSDVYGIVADNAGEESIRQLAEKMGYHYLTLPNPGYGAAVNAAIGVVPAGIEWIVISNPDVRFSPGSIDQLLSAADDPTIGAVGPRILDDDGVVYPSARAIPSLRTGIGHALFSRIWPANPWTRRYHRSGLLEMDEPTDAGWLSGSCLLVRRTAFEAIGGFDERYFMYFEDVDLGYRLGKAGFRNRYQPRSLVHHIGGTSTQAHSVEMTAEHHRSASLFVARKYRGVILSPLRLVIDVGLRVRSALATRRR